MNFSSKMPRENALAGKITVVTGGKSSLGNPMARYFMDYVRK